MSALVEARALLDRVEGTLPAELPSADLESVEDLTRKMMVRGELLTQLSALDVSSLRASELASLRQRVSTILEKDARLGESLRARTREIADRSQDAVTARAAMRGYGSAARREEVLGQERKA